MRSAVFAAHCGCARRQRQAGARRTGSVQTASVRGSRRAVAASHLVSARAAATAATHTPPRGAPLPQHRASDAEARSVGWRAIGGKGTGGQWGRGAAPMILLANPEPPEGQRVSVKQRRTWPNSMSEAVVPEAPEAPWFPRPRGAAPHGPGGVPKKWNHATGSWESHPAAACLLHESSAAPRLVPRPRGAVREPDRTFPRLAIDPFLFPENSRAKETPFLLLPPVAGAVPEFPFAANSSPSLRGALACVRAVSA
jgi:hypothetical protein